MTQALWINQTIMWVFVRKIISTYNKISEQKIITSRIIDTTNNFDNKTLTQQESIKKDLIFILLKKGRDGGREEGFN